MKQFCVRGHDTFIIGRSKYNGTCNECKRNKQIEYHKGHKTEAINYSKDYRKTHKDESRTYQNKKYILDVNYRLAKNLRNRLYNAIKNIQKSGSAVKDLGCTIEELKKYLEAKFMSGMTWDNRGNGTGMWNIDHMSPLSKFNLSNRSQFLKAVHYTNLQPLWWKDNIKKGNRIVKEMKHV